MRQLQVMEDTGPGAKGAERVEQGSRAAPQRSVACLAGMKAVLEHYPARQWREQPSTACEDTETNVVRKEGKGDKYPYKKTPKHRRWTTQALHPAEAMADHDTERPINQGEFPSPSTFTPTAFGTGKMDMGKTATETRTNDPNPNRGRVVATTLKPVSLGRAPPPVSQTGGRDGLAGSGHTDHSAPCPSPSDLVKLASPGVVAAIIEGSSLRTGNVSQNISSLCHGIRGPAATQDDRRPISAAVDAEFRQGRARQGRMISWNDHAENPAPPSFVAPAETHTGHFPVGCWRTSLRIGQCAPAPGLHLAERGRSVPAGTRDSALPASVFARPLREPPIAISSI
ncbi:hypothetical protein CSOJ01_07341 [Colletotrichum sojae]|uniref:Uncharacterized protein n=1 Tax=Colletotrichum sojae TaxID=2175907 RepID=A0A8H6JA28_9PEZI|nr:hypothetical protein CSOJ01_07341 [Colletotrichum sojae]